MTGVIDQLAAGDSVRVKSTYTYPEAGTFTLHIAPDLNHPAWPWYQTSFTVLLAAGEVGVIPAPTQCKWQKKTATSAAFKWTWNGVSGSIEGFRVYEFQLGPLTAVGPGSNTAVVSNLPVIPPTADFYVVAYNGSTESARMSCTFDTP
jgi:hypothetical protein